MKTKRCSKCKKVKPVEMFSTDNSTGDKLYALCKSCVHVYQIDYIAREKPAPASEPRICTQCLVPKPLDDFYQDKSRSDGYSKICKACKCAKRQEYALANPEKVKADKLAWKKTPAGRALQDRYYTKNKDTLNARKRQRYADDPGKILAKIHAWRIKNPEKAQSIVDRGNAKRAERLANAPINDFTITDWLIMLEAFEYRCAYCGKNSSRLERDHIIPLAKGGAHTASNIVPACRSCNAKKGTRHLQ